MGAHSAQAERSGGSQGADRPRRRAGGCLEGGHRHAQTNSDGHSKHSHSLIHKSTLTNLLVLVIPAVRIVGFDNFSLNAGVSG